MLLKNLTFDGTIRLESQDRLSKGSYMVPTSDQANDFIQKNALSSGVTNAVINGVIGWFMFRGKDTLPLTVDTISGHEKTVFSTGVMTAFILSLILGMIAFFTFRQKAKDFHVASPELLERPFFFFGVRTVLFYALFVFGTVALAALFLQKFLGTILVTPIIGAIILGIIAGIASWFINAAVMKAIGRTE
ncbi:conserved membrane hypothetical protein [Microcystis aeruginosa PCC 9443]|uniref:Uncharacterized protein n=2 Tax=Microcystis aeruginosa TaxID=1126 RepID=I4G2L9_MICAE|nr:conserved membrane hypothetical protein [Microcystis aeruginosa PCC 9443]